MSESGFVRACQPPWLVFPDLDPDELSRHLKQGVAEPWFDQQWRPFWSRLSPLQKEQYLDFWTASPDWRAALAFAFDQDGAFDAEADVRESAEYLQQRRSNGMDKRSVWDRFFRSR